VHALGSGMGPVCLSFSAASRWFFFGSSHPCEILIVRQKDYHVQVAERHHRDDVESLQEFARNVLVKEDYQHFARNMEDYSNLSGRRDNMQHAVFTELREKVSRMTPAQCAWQAITWHSPS
jgi:hypothetical protein